MSRSVTFILAFACGMVAATVYYIQPLVGLVSRDFGMSLDMAGLLVTVTQLGYATGLLMIVPLGDIVENRRLIAAMLALLSVALVAATFVPSAILFLLASILIGICASTVQIMVPLAGHLAPPAQRGQVVGSVVSGLFFGIMLARPVASFVAHFLGHRSIFALSALALIVLIAALWRLLPDRRPAGMPYFRALASLGPLLMRHAVLRRRMAYQTTIYVAFSMYWTAIPLMLEGPRFGFNQVGIGFFALAGAAGAIISPYAGKAVDRGHGALITSLALGGAGLAFLVALLGGLANSWPLLLVAALGIDMAMASHLVTGQQEIFSVDPEARGRLNGMYLATFFVGGAVGSLASSSLYAAAGWTAVALSAAALPLLALLYDTFVWRRKSVPAES
jgi:predicted MFS family arabinose efflux permease